MKGVAVTKDNFETEVLKCEDTVLIDFYADWCVPCKMMSPVLDEIAEEYPDVKVMKCNVDENQELAEEYNIMSIPFLALFKKGKLVKTAVGFQPKITLEGFIED